MRADLSPGEVCRLPSWTDPLPWPFREQRTFAHAMSLSYTLYGKLQELENKQRRERRRELRRHGLTDWRVGVLEQDVGYLSLLLASLLVKLDEAGSVSRQDLKRVMDELDDFDGVKDRRLKVSILRAATDSETQTGETQTGESQAGEPDGGGDRMQAGGEGGT